MPTGCLCDPPWETRGAPLGIIFGGAPFFPGRRERHGPVKTREFQSSLENSGRSLGTIFRSAPPFFQYE